MHITLTVVQNFKFHIWQSMTGLNQRTVYVTASDRFRDRFQPPPTASQKFMLVLFVKILQYFDVLE